MEPYPTDADVSSAISAAHQIIASHHETPVEEIHQMAVEIAARDPKAEKIVIPSPE